MDLLRGKIKNLYFKYLAAAFGSALITSIYSIVDMAMVGQYQGPEGVAALAVVDMVKGVDRSAAIDYAYITAKSGGRSGTWTRADLNAPATQES